MWEPTYFLRNHPTFHLVILLDNLWEMLTSHSDKIGHDIMMPCYFHNCVSVLYELNYGILYL